MHGQDLNLVKIDFNIIENERAGDREFFDLTYEGLERHELKLRPQKDSLKSAKELKGKIPSFVPESVRINDEDTVCN